MNNLTSNKWFMYGLPEDQNAPLYGLYNSITESIFLVHYNPKTIRELAILFSSRLALNVCRIDIASNYELNIVDNEVCVNWGVKNTKNFPLTRIPQFNSIIDVEELVYTENKESPYKFEELQVYLMAACNWLEFQVPRLIEADQQLYKKYDADYIEALPGIPFSSPFKAAVEQIREIIYTEFDFTVAENKIQEILCILN